MAIYIGSHGHKVRSPSPVTGSPRCIKLGKLLGDFGGVHKHFPELGSSDHYLTTKGPQMQASKTDSASKETVEQDASLPAIRRASLPHSIWGSTRAIPDQSNPKLGKLDKLERLGLLHIDSSKGSSPRANTKSTSQAHGALKPPLQGYLPISSCTTRLQEAYGLPVHNLNDRDSSFTIVDTDSLDDADNGSVTDLVSKATTPATNPDLTLNIQAKIDAIISKATSATISQDTAPPPPKVNFTVPLEPWQGANPTYVPPETIPQIPQLPPGLSSAGTPSNLVRLQEQAQRYRSDIAARVAVNSTVLRHGEAIVLPWDGHGNYTVVEFSSHQKSNISYGSKSAYRIEPYYRVEKATQLAIVKARLAQMAFDRRPKHATFAAAQIETPVMAVDPMSVDKTSQPVHIFVDMSNIVIGFYNYMRQERNLAPQQRIQAPFFFEALATILERGRPCAKRIVVGSMGPGAPWEDYMFEAQSCGYTMHVLQRVKGMKPSKAVAQTSPSTLSPSNGGNVHHEQGVDEILQLHMMLSIVDTPTPFREAGEPLSPGTMILATGDGAEAEFSDGFFNHVLRALKHGWCVEIVGFQRNMNQVWNEHAIPAEWRTRFRKIPLDDFAEELLAGFR